MKKPELLAPGGSLEKLKTAIDYGADAVYLAGKSFGMRSAPSNFTNEELEEAVKYCHAQGVKSMSPVIFCRITQNLPRCRRFSSFARQSV